MCCYRHFIQQKEGGADFFTCSFIHYNLDLVVSQATCLFTDFSLIINIVIKISSLVHKIDKWEKLDDDAGGVKIIVGVNRNTLSVNT